MKYLRGINLIAGEMDGMVYFYILNEHGDVAQIWKESGTRKSIYEYDNAVVEKGRIKQKNKI